MTNSNRLEGIRCPKCEQEKHFRIHAAITCLVTDDGSEPAGDHEWDDKSGVFCPDCGFNDRLKEFRVVPPDPDRSNADRASWAAVALNAFQDETGADDEDALGDLLCDLMHWCDRSGYEMDVALERARGHYEAETGGEDAA
jgi:hypothetical protein